MVFRYYERLELPRKATASEIKAAYFRAAKVSKIPKGFEIQKDLLQKYHPDFNKTAGAEEKFREIAEAYEVLGNSRLKRLYDKEMYDVLKQQRHPQKPEPEVQEEPLETVAEHRHNTWRKLKRKSTIMSGRTQHFDYDEWSQAHYSHMFAKRMEAKERFDERNVHFAVRSGFQGSKMTISEFEN